MNPAVIIIFTVFAFVALITKMSFDHELAKKRVQASKPNGLIEGEKDNSLTVSELNTMIEQAVDEAVAPLKARIKALEGGTADADTPPALPEGRIDADLLEFPDEAADEAQAPARSRERS